MKSVLEITWYSFRHGFFYNSVPKGEVLAKGYMVGVQEGLFSMMCCPSWAKVFKWRTTTINCDLRWVGNRCYVALSWGERGIMDLIIPEGINRGDTRGCRRPRGWSPKGDSRQNPEFDSRQCHCSPIQDQQCCRGMIISTIIPRGAIVDIFIPPC